MSSLDFNLLPLLLPIFSFYISYVSILRLLDAMR
jgi:hypothetical protein